MTTKTQPILLTNDARMSVDEVKTIRLRIDRFNTVPGCRVGDFIRRPDGSLLRIAHDWSDDHVNNGDCIVEVQPVSGSSSSGSFYMSDSHCDMSGGLDNIEKHRIKPTNETKQATAWTFPKYSGAGEGRDFTTEFRVFQSIEQL